MSTGSEPPMTPPGDTRPDHPAAQRGVLYVVATPIGNLGDLSPRARQVLASVDLIAAEDTRHTRQLLQACGIEANLTSLHEHNEAQRSRALLARVQSGESLALVSDAGTPLVSDPGYELIATAHAHSVPVVAVPGPCAAIAALSIAGLPTDRFIFEGFLPARSAARKARLEALCIEQRTIVLYEAPHRLADTLADLIERFGRERPARLCRELTKRFETTYGGTLAELGERLAQDPDMSRGEMVLIIGGNPQASSSAAFSADQVLRTLLAELPPSQAARIASRLTGEKRSELYERALQLTR